MWTAVIGEHDRSTEDGHEQRIMVEKIYLHERFKEYHHDIGIYTTVKTTLHTYDTEKWDYKNFVLYAKSAYEAAETS